METEKQPVRLVEIAPLIIRILWLRKPYKAFKVRLRLFFSDL